MSRTKSRDLIDAKLREYAACGVAFHHAGLDINDRRAVETMFIEGGLKLIVSTSVSTMRRIMLNCGLLLLVSIYQLIRWSSRVLVHGRAQ